MLLFRKWLAKRGIIKPLILILKNKSDTLRLNAVNALGELKNPKIIQPICNILTDEVTEIRVAAAKALEPLKSEEAIEPLKFALQDKEQIVRVAASMALFQFGTPVSLFGHAWIAAEGTEKQQFESIKELKKAGAEAFIPLRAALDKGKWQVKSKAAEMLSQMNDQKAVSPLIIMLEDTDADVRQAAAAALGKLKNKDAIEPLNIILGNTQENLSVLRSAAHSLAQYHIPDSLLGHIWLLGIGSKAEKEAAEKVIQDAGEMAFTPLHSVLSDGYWTVRRAAASAMSILNDPRSLDPLIKALEDEDWQVRMEVATTLGKLGSSKAFRPLRKLLSDKNWKIREVVAISIGKLKVKAALEPLTETLKDSKAEVRLGAVKGIAELGAPEGIDPLASVLKDTNPEIRRAASEALGQFNDEAAVLPLCKTLKDSNDDVRVAAAMALGKIKNKKAFKYLTEALSDWYSIVGKTAANSLIELGTPYDLWGHAWLLGGGDSVQQTESQKIINKAGKNAFEALAESLKDWNSEIRSASAKALGNLKDPRAVDPLCHEATKSPLDKLVIDSVFKALVKIQKPGSGICLADGIMKETLQKEDLPQIKMFLKYIREFAKLTWLTKEDREKLLQAYKMLIERGKEFSTMI